MSDVYVALTKGDVDTARTLLDQQGTQGEQGAAGVIRGLIDRDPGIARQAIAGRMALAMGPKNFASAYKAYDSVDRNKDLHPALMRKGMAEARQAGVDASYAEDKNIAELQKMDAETSKLTSDAEVNRRKLEIDRLRAKSAGMSAGAQKRKLELEIAEKERKELKAARGKEVHIDLLSENFDRTISTIDRIRNNPFLHKALGGIQGADFYPNTLADMLDPWSDSTQVQSLIADIEMLQSGQMIDNLVESKSFGAVFGALNKTEGKNITYYKHNLSRKQSGPEFLRVLDGLEKTVLGSRRRMAKMHGIEETPPETPEAEMSPEDATEAVRRYAPHTMQPPAPQLRRNEYGVSGGDF